MGDNALQAKTVFWPQKLWYSLLCPTTDLGKITSTRAFLSPIINWHGWEELWKLSKGGELWYSCHKPGTQQPGWDQLAKSKWAQAHFPVGNHFSQIPRGCIKAVWIFKNGWYCSYCKEQGSVFAFMFSTTVTRAGGTLCRPSPTS